MYRLIVIICLSTVVWAKAPLVIFLPPLVDYTDQAQRDIAIDIYDAMNSAATSYNENIANPQDFIQVKQVLIPTREGHYDTIVKFHSRFAKEGINYIKALAHKKQMDILLFLTFEHKALKTLKKCQKCNQKIKAHLYLYSRVDHTLDKRSLAIEVPRKEVALQSAYEIEQKSLKLIEQQLD